MLKQGKKLFAKITARHLYYKGEKKISVGTDYDPFSNVYDNERSAAGSDVMCSFLQFYTGIELQRMKVLDAGGGTGLYAKALIEHGVGNVSLVDASKGMLEVAKTNLADDIKSGVVRSIVHHNMPPIPFPDASFHAVLFSLCFAHVDLSRQDAPICQTLQEARRVLKPGGVVLISDIIKSTASDMWVSKLDGTLGERYTMARISLKQYEEGIHQAGLSCIQRINLLGSDVLRNYYKTPRSYASVYLNIARATNDEKHRVNQMMDDLNQKGKLNQWVAEHDNTTGLLTIFVCRAN